VFDAFGTVEDFVTVFPERAASRPTRLRSCRAMPIRALLDVDGAAFGPEDIKAIAAAHEMVLTRLKVEDRKSAMAFLVARTVVQIAKDGERDPQRLSERVIRVLQKAPL
jgi:hypothetical protein